jgi:hypothetical protein
MDWIDLDQEREQWRAPVNTVMSLRVPFLSNCATGSFSRRAKLHGVSELNNVLSVRRFQNDQRH